MNQDLSNLSLTELYDRLSEFTARYSKSMLNGFSEKDFAHLRIQIEQLQTEIANRKKNSGSHDNKKNTFPPHKSARA